MNFNQKINKNKGITLIALVVTIIVLLILAGISITMLTGQNGILKRAVEAKDITSEAQLAEDIILEENEYRIDISAGNSNALNDLIQRLEKKGYEVTEDDGKINVKYKDWNQEIILDNETYIKKSYYSDFETAWNDANNNSTENADLDTSKNAKAYIVNNEETELYLITDVTVSKKIDVNTNLILNLNGKTLEFKDETGKGNQKYIYVSENGKLTINDETNNGKIIKTIKDEETSDYLIAVDGKLYINSGIYSIKGNSTKRITGFLIGYSNYNNTNDSKSGIYLETNGGSISVENTGIGSANGINCYDNKSSALIKDITIISSGKSGSGLRIVK